MSDFESFYRDHVQLVYALALSRSGDAWQAEDLTQETFLRAWQHFGALVEADPTARRAWLARTLRNLVIDTWRHRSLVSLEPLGDAEPAPAPDERAELRIDLTHALAGLDDTSREIVMLRYLEDLNSREIGEIMGLPEGTVRRRLAESRRVLADRLPQWAPEGAAR